MVDLCIDAGVTLAMPLTRTFETNLGAIGWSLPSKPIAKLDAASQTPKAIHVGIKRASQNVIRPRYNIKIIGAFDRRNQRRNLSQRCHIPRVSKRS